MTSGPESVDTYLFRNGLEKIDKTYTMYRKFVCAPLRQYSILLSRAFFYG